MPNLTSNFGLKKPLAEEFYDVQVQNDNMDIIDEELKKRGSITVNSEVPEDAEIWIDPDEETIEESHVADRNNPHKVTIEQIGATSKTLIWENADEYSSFAEQTIQLDGLSNYDAIEVLYSNGLHYPGYGTSVFTSGVLPNYTKETGNPYNTGYVLFADMGFEDMDKKPRYRIFEWVDNQINFDAAYCMASTGEYAKDNNKCIPLRIYGIKGVSK